MPGQDAAELLDSLVGLRSVVGTPNRDIVGFVAEVLSERGIEPVLLDGPEGDRQNLFATIGPADRPGLILSAHLDVVPAEEPDWQGDPFRLRRDGDRLIGRGTSDMKGFVAAVLSRVPAWVRERRETPLHIALSYDEEAGCRGVPHLLARLPELCAPPLGCLVGEPTGLQPVLSHKGKAGLRITGRGRSGHSARPDLGRNAIHSLVPALSAAVDLQARLEAEGTRDDSFAPPHSTVQIGVVEGGSALNIIPDRAYAQVEARVIAGQDPREVLRPVLRRAEETEGVEMEILCQYPGLAIGADHALVARAAEASGRAPQASVSFGTEAGLYSEAGIPTVVCGPGDMARAHSAEEFVLGAELDAAAGFLERFARDPGPA